MALSGESVIDLAWISTLVLFAIAGAWTLRDPDIARFDRSARVAIAFASGVVVMTVVMYVEALAGLRWSRWSLGVPLLFFLSLAFRRVRNRHEDVSWTRTDAVAFITIALLCVYGAATARMTIADLFFFWGPKAQHFFHARTIDVEFLKFPHYYLMHPDYPPLLPLAWSASSIVAGRFSWWGALIWAPIALVAAALAFRAFAAPSLGARKASAFAILLLAVMTFGALASVVAGGADAPLLLFQTVALSALTFSPSRGAIVVAAVALAGAVFTKVEGAAFVAVVVVALVLLRRFKTAVAVAIPAAILLVSWIAFARHHGLLDSYGRTGRQIHFENFGLVMQTATAKLSYGAYYLPWIAALAPFITARSFRAAALPLLVAGGSIAYTTYFYLNEPDPVFWILSSVERVMLTTLMSLVVASAAAAEVESRRDGVVPQREEAEGSGRETDRDSGGSVAQV